MRSSRSSVNTTRFWFGGACRKSEVRTMEQVFRHLVSVSFIILHFGLLCLARIAPFPSPHNSPAPAPERLHLTNNTGGPVPAPASAYTGSLSPVHNGPAPFSQAIMGPGSPPGPASIPSEAPDGSPSFAPAPAPGPAAEDDSNALESDTTLERESKSSGGLSGGQKAGITVGVLFGVAIVGTGGLIYKKRQDNIRRAQYGLGVRREQL